VTVRAAGRLIAGAALLGSLAWAGAPAAAQDALMTTGAGVARGGLVLTGYPVLLPAGENEAGFFVRGAYGASGRLGLRTSLGVYNDLTYLGAAGELALPALGPVALSLSLGGHYSAFDEGSPDILGLDLSLVGRHALAARWTLYGGLDLDLERPAAPYDAFARTRLVAGVETTRIAGTSLLLEGGLGFGDDSPSYLSVGVAVRLR